MKLIIKLATALFIMIPIEGSNETKHDYKMGVYCKELDQKYKNDNYRQNGPLMMNGVPKRLIIMSSSKAPSQAAAAILAAAIRHKAGYTNVYTRIDNRSVRELAATVSRFHSMENFTDEEMLIHVDAEWLGWKDTGPALPRCDSGSHTCSIAGSRLKDLRESPSVNLRLYAALSSKIEITDCNETMYWLFYKNLETLQQCGFEQPHKSKCIPVLVPHDVENPPSLESENGKDIKFCAIRFLNRTDLNKEIEQSKDSFLFIDYDLGHENNYRVNTVSMHLFPVDTRALLVADYKLLIQYSPSINHILNVTAPRPEHLRQVLDFNSNTNDMDEAACEWAEKNNNTFISWTQTPVPELMFVLIKCKKDKDKDHYNNILHKVFPNIMVDIFSLTSNQTSFEFNFIPGPTTIDCSDSESVNKQLSAIFRWNNWQTVAGVAVPNSGAKAAAMGVTRDLQTQVVFYDVPPSNTPLHISASTVTGSVQLLARAIRHFLKKQAWSRIAIISEISDLASSLTIEILKENVITQHKEKKLNNTLDPIAIKDTLLSLRKDNARIILLNAKSTAACLIIREAEKLSMVDDAEYAWIVRDWRPEIDCMKINVQVFTVSYWWRGGKESFEERIGKSGNHKIRSSLNQIFGNETWPPLTTPIVDAFILMIKRMQMMMKRPSMIDIHPKDFQKRMTEISHEMTDVEGVVDKIELRDFVRHKPLVFVYAWRGKVNNLVAVWRAQSNAITEVISFYEPHYSGKKPQDKKTKCVTSKSGDDFNPLCHDPFWVILIFIIVVTPIILWKVRRARMARMERQERETRMRLLSRCNRTAALLTPHLVNRSALELYEELGSGHFGRVRFGMLRIRNRLPTPVAAKTLRENAAPAEEIEFLREASTMASIFHDHVIRLVGVCADMEGPPLLLMEHAFFGDLLKYLRQRRHLAEIIERDLLPPVDVLVQERDKDKNACPDPEAFHVTAAELTRLAREAASALAFLGEQHILHRDVRAANCLVDARRTLKLADFGMARNVEASKNRIIPEEPDESEDYKYICRRRGVFAVPWMAPESLDRGEFSRASDVWALGVLMLEITTLGARPYGAWRPLQVVRFVRSGGKPPLPRDASYHTCEITEKCWNDIPSERPTAKEISEYLVEHPRALRAALRPAWPEPDCTPGTSDSGFGERDDEWGRGADLRVSTF